LPYFTNDAYISNRTIIRETMAQLNASRLLVENFQLLEATGLTKGVLDLACGRGRNGLFLLQSNIPTTFADNNPAALRYVSVQAAKVPAPAVCWLVDLEDKKQNPFESKCFDAILVFNYLHRPLIEPIKNAVDRGGYLFYETFTIQQREIGRPQNPNYLLKPGELLELLDGWHVEHYFEGEQENPRRAIANVIARKP